VIYRDTSSNQKKRFLKRTHKNCESKNAKVIQADEPLGFARVYPQHVSGEANEIRMPTRRIYGEPRRTQMPLDADWFGRVQAL